jgi:sulfate adenylyltransferase subunit 2
MLDGVSLPHLARLEDEAIFILREACAERERPAMLFSGGKDSIVMLRLAEKAFRPAKFPFPLLHVDTGQNFDEVIEFRDRRVVQLGERLIVARVQDSIDRGTATEDTGPRASRNRLQSVTLLEAIAEHKFDVLFGGARRDEDRARAKERIVSVRDALGQWNPSAQRPELWSLLNLHIRRDQHLRVFPISNWTELDVWQYIEAEQLELPSIYYAHRREVFERDRMLYGVTAAMRPALDEPVFEEWVRFRTVGDSTCTGAVRSRAAEIVDVITEIIGSDITERGATRADDKFSEAAMEDRKREGYF